MARSLYGLFRVIEALANALPVAALAAVLGGGALAAFGWLGSTVLTLTFAGAERVYPVRGRNTRLLDFAEAVSRAADAGQAVGERIALLGPARVSRPSWRSKGELKRISAPVSPRLEMTEICDRVLRAGGPALLFEQPAGHDIPVLGNLFGTVRPRRGGDGRGGCRRACGTSASCSPT